MDMKKKDGDKRDMAAGFRPYGITGRVIFSFCVGG